MQPMKLATLAKALGIHLADDQTQIHSISIDSRQVDDKTLFVAIKGERFDGHDYILQALESGAPYAVSAKEIPGVTDRLLLVKDTEQALCDLAGCYRDQFDIPVVGVTGSVGKTTTKEMIARFLSAQYRVHKTEGNFNNQIGMPQTLLSLSDQDTAAVIEMGAQGPGEIRQLTLSAKPQVAVITKIGVSHLEQFGSQEEILKGKLEIAEGLPANGTLVLNADDPFLMRAYPTLKANYQVCTFGIQNKQADVVAKEISGNAYTQSFILCFQQKELPVALPVGGLHNVYNALAAFCVGTALGVDPKAGLRAVAGYEPAGQRQKITRLEDRVLIEDCYNASPDSMEAALKLLAGTQGTPRIAVLGDMLELGRKEKQAHLDMGRLAAGLPIDCLICIGKAAKWYAEGAAQVTDTNLKVLHFEQKKPFYDAIFAHAVAGSSLLFKASRGMRLEEAVLDLKSRFLLPKQ